ncbi:Uncharacterised protein [Mycobacteroides abscessus subsp. abscessus]|nr:Uncharacterised protein [Mycobacteroides abscessus subsp. abscessus]
MHSYILQGVGIKAAPVTGVIGVEIGVVVIADVGGLRTRFNGVTIVATVLDRLPAFAMRLRSSASSLLVRVPRSGCAIGVFQGLGSRCG